MAPQLQRMLADDLMAAVFPDAAACLENIPGDRQIPDHPLVNQTVRDCLQEAMDFDGLRAVLERIHRGELRLLARDTPEPSVFAHDILNARPYAFLDDAPLEERRAHAVQTRRGGATGGVEDTGALDAAAIARVRDEARPDPRDADELHDALMTAGFLTGAELARIAPAWIDDADHVGRATRVRVRRARRTRAAGRRRAAAGVAGRASGRRARSADRASRPSRAARLDARRGARRARRAAASLSTDRSTAAALAAALGVAERGRRRRAAGARRRKGVVLRGTLHAVGTGPAHASTPARMVRPRAARAHPSLHAEPAARGDRAGHAGRLHAVPVHVAARRRRRAG